jgi:GntR family transcriptional regulator
MSGQIDPPRYRQIADTLMHEIQSGAAPVGTRLPGEFELSDRFDVSRHTVREALRLLEDVGVIGRRKGFGTVVLSNHKIEAFVQSVNDVADLFQYPAGTQLQIEEQAQLAADDALASRLGVAHGTEWVRLSGLRCVLATGQRICWTDVYVIPEYASVRDFIGRDDRPVHGLLEQRFGERIANVELEISAESLSDALSSRLVVDRGAPALSIIRRYRGNGGRVCEVSVTTHPADQFTYRLNLAREGLDGKGGKR